MLAETLHPHAALGSSFSFNLAEHPARPSDTGPLFDQLSSTQPLADFCSSTWEQTYASKLAEDGTSPAPPKPAGFTDPYLYPMLTLTERARLTMLWYLTKDVAGDGGLLQRLQDKVKLLQTLLGWDFAICGLLDNDRYHRLATAGLPLAILPRRESTCAHTVQQAPGSVFYIPDMSRDWRFQASPHVEHGGLRSYAGTQLRCRSDDGQELALGSLCVASNTPNKFLSQEQQEILVKFSNMLAEDIMNSSRHRRAKQQQFTDRLLREPEVHAQADQCEANIIRILQSIYPNAEVRLMPTEDGAIRLRSDGPSLTPTDIMCTVWEDHDLIDVLLQTHNHEKLQATRPVRAIVGKVRAPPVYEALVVATNDVTHVFDDIDVRFVEACASILSISAQEKSLQAALKGREEFMRGLTHQLRTPIHGILGAVDLLREELTSNERPKTPIDFADGNVEETLRMIKMSGRELMSTVNSVIKFNRLAETVRALRTVTYSDLEKLETEILEEVSYLLPKAFLTRVSMFFDNRLPKGMDLVMSDHVLLKDCLQSLVLNALQNTTRGSVVITISASSDYSRLTFDVEDTGCGIASVDHERIFDPYVTITPEAKGVGLGLTLARKTAAMLNGSITLVSSEPGEGSHFRAEFNDPGFACAFPRRDPPVAVDEELPKQYLVISSEPRSAALSCFTAHLKGRGYEEGTPGKYALAIVGFAESPDEFGTQLDSADKARVTISLVPPGRDFTLMKDKYPDVIFFDGPYTSSRLKAMLVEIGDAVRRSEVLRPPSKPACEALNKSPIPNLVQRKDSYQSVVEPSKSCRAAPRCLLVDDNMINLRILRMFCDKRNYPFATAMDGFEAIDAYKAALEEGKAIDLILLDLQMPKCDGIQACTEIRAIEGRESRRPALIYIVTGQDSPSDKLEALAAGANEFFVKPLALKSLDRAIAQDFGNG